VERRKGPDMTDKQAKSLEEYLTQVLAEAPLTEEMAACLPMYRDVRDTIRLNGAAGLETYLDRGAKLEYDEGYTAYVPYSEMNDILFGDMSFVPVLMEKYPTLCKWRLSAEGQA